MNYQGKFPVYRNATRLVVETESAVKDFPRYKKYTLGSEMRTFVYDLLTVMLYTINNKNDRKQLIKKAHQFSKVLKIQIAKQISDLSFKVFETLASLVINLSKQCKTSCNTSISIKQSNAHIYPKFIYFIFEKWCKLEILSVNQIKQQHPLRM
ncbi:hypothetical protein [Bathymodiolus thermophilus thioautotrophic gill symbiont]|nr:hypothetical protein [Bathymodiolus thermophilus thioautotrophic gill symbiont]